MAKMTKKYVAAQEAARRYGLFDGGSSEELYKLLQENNLWWNVGNQSWEKGKEPNPPTGSLYIRVWGEGETVSAHAAKVAELLQEEGYQQLELSEPYPCRPPKQKESRVYIQFLPPVEA